MSGRLTESVGTGFGLYASQVILDIPYDPGRSLAETAHLFQSRLTEAMTDSALLGPIARLRDLPSHTVDLIGRLQMLKSRRRTGLTVTNIGRVDLEHSYGPLTLEALCPVPYIRTSEKTLGLATFRGSMTSLLPYRDTVIAEATIGAVRDRANGNSWAFCGMAVKESHLVGRGSEGSAVVETDKLVLFWKPPAVYSQWTPAKFAAGNVTYCCAEQYMMAEKARLFGDDIALTAILSTQDPAEHKRLGKTVRGFNHVVWNKYRFLIVVRGNLAKFSQNELMKLDLLRTGDKILAEASPWDRIWGIGHRADELDALDPDRWRGLNLLGKALMEVRAQLRTG